MYLKKLTMIADSSYGLTCQEAMLVKWCCVMLCQPNLALLLYTRLMQVLALDTLIPAFCPATPPATPSTAIHPCTQPSTPSGISWKLDWEFCIVPTTQRHLASYILELQTWNLTAVTLLKSTILKMIRHSERTEWNKRAELMNYATPLRTV